jgi:ABC-type transport system involved in multi-copper enzyme maturation permease subunit
MSSIQSMTEEPLPSPVRRDTVVMGRHDFLSVVLRLIGVELYKIRRRTMSKVLSTIGILIMLMSFAITSLVAIVIASEPASSLLPPPCSSVSDPLTQPCLAHPPTQSDLARAEQEKQDRVIAFSEPLRLPTSIGTANQVVQSFGLVLIVILAGTIVGGEYNVGTIRLMFTRGPTRTQFLLSKIGAVLTCIAFGVVGGILLGVVSGAIMNLFTGIGVNFHFLTGIWIVQVLLLMLAAMLALFVYAMMAICLSTLGRATAAGVAGTLVWWVLEGLLGSLFSFAGGQLKGFIGDFLRAIPDYFIGNNVSALLGNQGGPVFGGTPSQLSDVHAILVILAYLALFIGLSWWVNERRDITN